jgi:hypothetical protein
MSEGAPNSQISIQVPHTLQRFVFTTDVNGGRLSARANQAATLAAVAAAAV